MMNPSLRDAAVFPLIADPASYRAQTLDLVGSADHRAYWLDVFRRHTPGLAKRAAESEGDTDEARSRATEFHDRFLRAIQTIAEAPEPPADLSIAKLCAMRQQHLIDAGFENPYREMKQAENETALALLPKLLTELDGLAADARLPRLIRNVFAGNVFDMGSMETIKLYETDGIDFQQTCARLPERPWLVDDLDTLERNFAAPRHRKAVMFVDNAGADVLLGMIPLARHLLQRGTNVVLTANTQPALNDITHAELGDLIRRIAAFDEVIRNAVTSRRLTLVASGNGLPVIDLTTISPQLAAAATDADLLVLEGMGRALETNWLTRFTVDTLKLAMVKEQDVADYLGGKLYDVVCRFEPV